MRLVTAFLLLSLSIACKAEIFTFQTSGNYSNTSNWDSYPGSNIENGDTINIEANIYIDVSLDVYDGLVLFTSDVDEVEIDYVTIWYGSKIEIESSSFELTIFGSLDYNDYVDAPNLFSVYIVNFGDGIVSGQNIFEFIAIIDYSNFGIQEDYFFNGFSGSFTNEGIIQVQLPILFLSCSLDLVNGTIEGYSPFSIIQQGGSIYQTCSSCTSYTNNCTTIEIVDAEIQGSWVID